MHAGLSTLPSPPVLLHHPQDAHTDRPTQTHTHTICFKIITFGAEEGIYVSSVWSLDKDYSGEKGIDFATLPE